MQFYKWRPLWRPFPLIPKTLLDASRVIVKVLKPCVHDQKTWTKISIQEICNQLTCSFYGKAVILLAKDFLDRKRGPSSLIVDTRLNVHFYQCRLILILV